MDSIALSKTYMWSIGYEMYKFVNNTKQTQHWYYSRGQNPFTIL